MTDTMLIELPDSGGAWVNPQYVTAIIPEWENDGVSGASWVDVYVVNCPHPIGCLYADVKDETSADTKIASLKKRDAVVAVFDRLGDTSS